MITVYLPYVERPVPAVSSSVHQGYVVGEVSGTECGAIVIGSFYDGNNQLIETVRTPTALQSEANGLPKPYVMLAPDGAERHELEIEKPLPCGNFATLDVEYTIADGKASGTITNTTEMDMATVDVYAALYQDGKIFDMNVGSVNGVFLKAGEQTTFIVDAPVNTVVIWAEGRIER